MRSSSGCCWPCRTAGSSRRLRPAGRRRLAPAARPGVRGMQRRVPGVSGARTPAAPPDRPANIAPGGPRPGRRRVRGPAPGGAGYWQVVDAAPLSADPNNPAVIAAATAGAARRDRRPRRGAWLARNERDANGEPYRVYRDAVAEPRHRLRLAPVRDGRSRAGLRRRARRPRPARPGRRPPEEVRRATRTTRRRPDPQPVAGTPAARPSGRSATTRGRGDARPQDGRGAGPRLDAGLRRLGGRQPGHVRGHASAQLQADERQPLLPRATQGRYVPGSVLQDRDRARGPGVGRRSRPRPRSSSSRPRSATASSSQGFRVRDGHHPSPAPRRSTSSRRPRCRATSGTRWPASRRAARSFAEVAGRLGFGDADPVRPADRGLAGDERRRRRSRAASRTTSSWRTPPYGQGETLVTPLQMALVAAAVANDGVLMRAASRDGARAARAVRATIRPEAMAAGRLARTTRSSDPGRHAGAPSRASSGSSSRRAPTCRASRRPASPARPSWAAPASRTRGSSASRRSTTRRSRSRSLVERGGRGGERAAPIAGDMMEAALKELNGG